MFVPDDLREAIKPEFTPDERFVLNEAVTARTKDPPGFVINERLIGEQLFIKLKAAVRKARAACIQSQT